MGGNYMREYSIYFLQDHVIKWLVFFLLLSTHAIITLSEFETALDYKPRILDPKIEEFPCLVHKLSVTVSALQYKPK